jgi:hypothetical protein
MVEWSWQSAPGRVWVVVSEARPEERHQLLRQFAPPEWRVEPAATFEATDVFLLSRGDAASVARR